MSYDHFETLDQVVSWARYLVKDELRDKSDLTMQRIEGCHSSHRGWAFEQAVRLAVELPEEYTVWCTLQKLTGKRR